MKIPKTLKIGGHTYKIKIEKDRENMGSCDAKSSTIYIDGSMPHDQQESTLIHEVFHAINTTFGNDTLTHSLLDSFAEQFYQVLSDNKLIR